jgi:microcin C transport system substrate-binding protein
MLLPRRKLLIGSAALPFAGLVPRRIWADEGVAPVHALSLMGEPKYGPDFKRLDYVNPDAPKGGTLRQYLLGSFDNFNGYIVKGQAGPSSYIESLMTSPDDDSEAEYCLIAESVEAAPDKSWVAFNLRSEPKWHDGQPITVDDVIFSLNILKEKGRPFFRAYYANVSKVEQVGERKVKFTFNTSGNRELPTIMGQLAVLPKHYWDGRDFESQSPEPPLGSGPYKVDSFEMGRSVTLKRVVDYWGAKLPINVGQSNWDVIRYDYYRDSTVALEAFKAGQYDFRVENSAKNWATGYDTPALRDGRMKKAELPNDNPTGMQAFVYNIRRDLFKDRRVREALNYAFDFEWTNKTIFYGQYTRTKSYFSNSEFASSGLPSPEELKILEKYRGRIPDEVFMAEYQPPTTDGTGNNRTNLRKAIDILKTAGWEVKGGKLTNVQSGQPMQFEILLDDQIYERIMQPFIQNLARIGIQANVRTVIDSSQYKNRTDNYDYDMITAVFGESLSPGNEQRDFWGSASADLPGGSNLIGVKDPVVDELIDLIIMTPDRENLITRTRALDRVLLWSHYVIPSWHLSVFRVAYWDKFGRPTTTPKPAYGIGFDSWWIDPEKEAALSRGKTN